MSYHNDESQDHEDVRYRILKRTDGEYVVCCVQWFDYPDYQGTWVGGWCDDEKQAQHFADFGNKSRS